MESCPFCAIVQKRLPAEIVYEDENALAFRDIRPQAPVHVLIVPKEHVGSADEVQDPALWSRLMPAVKATAAKLGVSGGYRLVVNCGESAGQTVPHLHIHLLAGRGLQWPPG
ncbi:histidine triad nucleotide-binding protein [Pyramidobacter sp. YE332]|uniref:histidine triad nucleotide-binding protein n=1 Tax=Pyramidobacter sp. YE332 TaxID=3068894 RepID=UPI00098F5BE3|nr:MULTISPECIES: histidine triad nucleotide-binding protein [unclassified Pyramidobacter]OON86777.1 histidine triad nucleotide-binding protein [Pyramidobacter sp. C12-8]WOL41300.1 histidine triad nucleotide-binding protein [Pyramidobacter sp. YE332]